MTVRKPGFVELRLGDKYHHVILFSKDGDTWLPF